MDAGNRAREYAHDNAVLALGAVSTILAERKRSENYGVPLGKPKQVYIINSLKHPSEAELLRRVYGDGFYLLSVYSDFSRRKNHLERKGLNSEQAKELMTRDEAEDEIPFGQRTRDTFHLADFFVHLDSDEDKLWNTIERITQLIFGHPYVTPVFDEFAMFMAFSASLRSADLSRQVGALVARDREVLSTGANDCPQFGGGLYWPKADSKGAVRDEERGRDYTRGYDSNDDRKSRIVDEMTRNLTHKGHIGDETAIWEAVRKSPIDDITEYGRVVHAEMEALLACARSNIGCKGAHLYCTTFPCHNCAKHLIAAGITRVVYVEPYPKSLALDLHDDSAVFGFPEWENGQDKVTFEPFVGVGPRRFFDLFSMRHGSGYPVSRKDKETGKTLDWHTEHCVLRMPMLPWAYLQREELAGDRFNRLLEKGE